MIKKTPQSTVKTAEPLVAGPEAELDAIEREYALDKVTLVIAKVRLNFVINDVLDMPEGSARDTLEAKIKSVRATLI